MSCRLTTDGGQISIASSRRVLNKKKNIYIYKFWLALPPPPTPTHASSLRPAFQIASLRRPSNSFDWWEITALIEKRRTRARSRKWVARTPALRHSSDCSASVYQVDTVQQPEFMSDTGFHSILLFDCDSIWKGQFPRHFQQLMATIQPFNLVKSTRFIYS